MCGMDAPRKTQKPNQKKPRVNLSIQDDCIKNSSSTNGTLARLAFLNLTVTDYNNIFTRITAVYSTFLWHKVMLKNAKTLESILHLDCCKSWKTNVIAAASR